MSDYIIHYAPAPFGEIIPTDQCKHDPAGHLMCLGLRIESKGKSKRQQIVMDGQFCMKCGAGDHVCAENWIDLWWFAREELKGKCPQFDIRLTELAEAAYGDFSTFMNATVALTNERQATAIGMASR